VRTLQAVHRRAIAATELDQVTKSAGGDQGATRAAPLDHGIGGDGRAVQNRVELIRAQACRLQCIEQPHRGVVRGRRHFENLVRPIGAA
jgi:hypothetical protein